MKKTFNLNFIIRKVKQKSRATTWVYLGITVDGARTELSLQRECDSARWDSYKGRVRGKTEEVKSFNAYLDAVQLKIYDIFQSFISTGIDFDGEKIKARYLAFDVEKPRMFLEVYEEHNKEFEALVGKGLSYRTLPKYKPSKRTLLNF
jgi:hypothetical protein